MPEVIFEDRSASAGLRITTPRETAGGLLRSSNPWFTYSPPVFPGAAVMWRRGGIPC
jgi:hypothetical protein